jgi:ferredoxin
MYTMANIFKFGPNRIMVRIMVWLSWPIIKYGKKLSAVPVLKWLINPFFMRPYNEVTSIPIGVSVPANKSVPLPLRTLERLVSEVEDKFIIGECICRRHEKSVNPPADLGCMVLGPAIRRMHPSHGRSATTAEAVAHVRRAAKLGLIANIAHVWIDMTAFWVRFKPLMFICFCDDVNCIYRTHMKSRGPALDGAYKKLPGITVEVDKAKCDGCEICVDKCFVAAIEMKDRKAIITDDCKACGRCHDVCPVGAVKMTFPGEEEFIRQVKDRISAVSELPFISETPIPKT